MNQAIHLDKPTPFQPTASVDDTRLPASYANHRFVFVHYPSGWSFSEEHGFLPELSEIVGQPGVNGVGRDGNTNRAVGGAIQKGGTLINPQDRRLGPWVNHIGSYECKNGRKHWCWFQTRYTILPGGNVVGKDMSASFLAFRQYLREKGLVSPMEEAVYNQLYEIASRKYDRAVADASKNPLLADKARELGKRRDRMQAAWLALQPTLDEAGTEVELSGPSVDDPGFVIPTEPGKVRVGKPKDGSQKAEA